MSAIPPSSDFNFNPHFLVVSLGNPPPYTGTLHSAGHLALQSLQEQLHHHYNQPSFTAQRVAKKATQVSLGDKYLLMQSPTLMNVSGPWIAKAWRETLAAGSAGVAVGAGGQHPPRDPPRPLGLVIVNDDLEEDIAIVKVRSWERSHRGHNGLKSIMASLRYADYRDSRWAKISVGIGRPEGRDAATVSEYVLRPWSRHQRGVLSLDSGPRVLDALLEIEAAWRLQAESGISGEEPNKQPAKKARKDRPSARGTAGDKPADKFAWMSDCLG